MMLPQGHSAASGAGGSIIDILEVCESDFAKNLAAEEAQEADAIAVYEKTTQENKLSTTMKSQDVKYKTKEFKGLDKSISDLSGDKETSNTKLDTEVEEEDTDRDTEPESDTDRDTEPESDTENVILTPVDITSTTEVAREELTSTSNVTAELLRRVPSMILSVPETSEEPVTPAEIEVPTTTS
jgi:hypothetical protein